MWQFFEETPEFGDTYHVLPSLPGIMLVALAVLSLLVQKGVLFGSFICCTIIPHPLWFKL